METVTQDYTIVEGTRKIDCENSQYVKIINWIERFARAEERNNKARSSRRRSNYWQKEKHFPMTWS